MAKLKNLNAAILVIFKHCASVRQLWTAQGPTVCDVMQFRRVQCIKVLFCLTTFVLIVAYVQKLIFYVYYKFEAVQPPWPPSQLPRMVDYHFLQQKDLIYEPKILCWISTYPRNRLVSQEEHFTFFLGSTTSRKLFF